MRVLIINSVCGIGSTGRICVELAEQFEKEGHEVRIAYGRFNNVPEQYQKYAIRIGNNLDLKLHGLRTRILDEHGFGSVRSTKQFLKWADEFNPDLVWLHNIHGYYINVELLFQWIKNRPDMQVKWTLHDCWSFTGHCSHFIAVECEQWKRQCLICNQKNMYPASKLKDNCKNNYLRKKKAFCGVKNLILITPSKWLADLTRESFLKEYPVEVHYNTIDKTVFRPMVTDFKKRYCLDGKKIILGVASTWTERKGLYDFIELSKMLDSNYAIVLIGISEKQFEQMKEKKTKVVAKKEETKGIIKLAGGIAIPCNVNILYEIITGKNYKKLKDEKAKIICISRTDSTKELAEAYTAADYFVNPTYEDNYPTVNLEARACGTTVITYNIGGCIETLQ